jgi:hypothetical protein
METGHFPGWKRSRNRVFYLRCACRSLSVRSSRERQECSLIMWSREQQQFRHVSVGSLCEGRSNDATVLVLRPCRMQGHGVGHGSIVAWQPADLHRRKIQTCTETSIASAVRAGSRDELLKSRHPSQSGVHETPEDEDQKGLAMHQAPRPTSFFPASIGHAFPPAAAIGGLMFRAAHQKTNFGFGPDWECKDQAYGEPVCIRRGPIK